MIAFNRITATLIFPQVSSRSNAALASGRASTSNTAHRRGRGRIRGGGGGGGGVVGRPAARKSDRGDLSSADDEEGELPGEEEEEEEVCGAGDECNKPRGTVA